MPRNRQEMLPQDRIDLQKAVSNFKFECFDPDIEGWEYYIQRFELKVNLMKFCGNQDEVEEIKKNLILANIGPTVFKVLVDHFKPEVITDKSYDEIKEALGNYFIKKSCIMVERIKFSQRFRRTEEPILKYLNELRAIARNCDFGRSLNERLRDQLIIGINESSWQKELLKKFPSNNSTLEEVQKSAEILEQAFLGQNELQKLTLRDTQKVCKISSNKNRANDKIQPRKLYRTKDCFKCGYSIHGQGEKCPAFETICSACKRIGHFARVCLNKGRATINDLPKIRNIKESQPTTDSNNRYSSSESLVDEINAIYNIKDKGNKAIINVKLDEIPFSMLYDPGAAQTVLSKKIWEKLGSPELTSAQNLMAYSQVPVETLGKITVNVTFGNSRKTLNAFIVNTNDVPLFGLDWCQAFNLPFPKGVKICKISNEVGYNNNFKIKLNQLLKEFNSLFSDSVKSGTIKGHKAKILIKENIKGKVFPPRRVPFPMRVKVEEELERLVENDILEPIDTTSSVEWASPIVCIVKPTGKLRICGDFKVTVNPHILIDPHPLPTFEEILEKLGKPMFFSIIDLKDAYLQMSVEKSSRKYLIIATHKGYFQYKRLPFGVNFAPALFQKTMDQILTGLDKTASYIDDVIVAGDSEQDLLENLKKLFLRFKNANIRINKEKCKFLESSVTYLGHRIDYFGIHPTEERIKAIRDMPLPTNTHQLRSFLGAVNYYSKFIPNLQTLCIPLHRLIKKGVKWNWNESDSEIITKLKDIISSSNSLVHYDHKLPLILCSDASDYGIGSVLLHRFPNGEEKPIAYASRKLSTTEQRYAAIDKEALAIIFGLSKFYQYIFGKRIIIKTDHKPLERIFGEDVGIPKIISNRLARWALILNSFSYEIQHIKGNENTTADCLSRLPIGEKDFKEKSVDHILHLRLEGIPVSKKELQKDTANDEILSKVKDYVLNGWPKEKSKVKKEMYTFYEKRDCLSFEENILLWQGRVIIPERLRFRIWKMLHEGHPGICSMKDLAKFYVWWPGIDKFIEERVNECIQCQENRPRDLEVPLYSWNISSEPWARVHIDYAGLYEGKYWLIVIDSFTKWLEIFPVSSATSTVTIKILRELFARFGLPKIIVSDNGPQFTSYEFKEFCLSNGIEAITSTPYHPKTNGLAERAIRTFKERMNIMKTSRFDQNLKLQKFLMSYRNCPQKTTGRSPAEMMFGRRLRSRLDLLKPDVLKKMDVQIGKQKIFHDRKSKFREFEEGDKVWVEKVNRKGYEEGIVEKRTGEYSYLIKIDGSTKRKHADQLRIRREGSLRRKGEM